MTNMNQAFIARQISKDELDDLLELYTHHLFSTSDAPLPPRTEVQSLWDNIFDNQMLHYFVVEYEGRGVSTCTLTIIPNLTRGARPYGLIENVVTHKDFRGQGFSKALLIRV